MSHMSSRESMSSVISTTHDRNPWQTFQQIQIYQIINLPVPVGNYSMRYTMEMKYLGVTYDRTKAMDIPEEQ